MLLQVNQASFQLERGTSGFISNHCRGIWPHLELRGNLVIFSPVSVGSSGFLSSCDGYLGKL